jgi:succinate dehydrogenase/fumarate reductase flavoprotein subunit
MAGLSAAAWAVRNGGSVVLVEKGEVGGSAVYAGFIWTAPSLDVFRDWIPDGDPALAEQLVAGFEPAVEWVRSLGVECQPAVRVLRYGRGHQTALNNYLHACELIVRGDPRSELVHGEARRLLVEDGEVRGAEIALQTGETRTVRAGSTLLATGGFGGDPEERSRRIHANARDLPVRANTYSRGDGLRLGLAAGAAFGAEDAGFYGHLLASRIPFGVKEDFAAMTLFYSEHAILLNLAGRRFVDETVADHLTTLALVEQPEARGLLISDERVREDWIVRPYVEGVQAVDAFDLSMRRGARGAVAEDVDELLYLPPEWGYDATAVRQAVLDFNRECEEGSLDPPRRFDATPLDQPPYYVIEAVPAITFTFGGLLIDPLARVQDDTGRPIPGLLAAGADAGGVFVRGYAGGIANALVFGLRAARTALEGPATR